VPFVADASCKHFVGFALHRIKERIGGYFEAVASSSLQLAPHLHLHEISGLSLAVGWAP
jgi:hypothetical protein